VGLERVLETADPLNGLVERLELLFVRGGGVRHFDGDRAAPGGEAQGHLLTLAEAAVLDRVLEQLLGGHGEAVGLVGGEAGLEEEAQRLVPLGLDRGPYRRERARELLGAN